MRYMVKYNTLPIGIYNVISSNCVEYTVDKEQLRRLEKEGIELNPMLKKDFTGKAFPFFDNRISNSKRFENVSIGYHTDPFTLEEIK